jgi:hypothetical protein
VADRAERYRQRWQVETALAQLKTTRQMDGLHYKTVSRVLKELTVFAIVYNLGPDQLPGCPALAQRAKSWPAMRSVDREPPTPPAGRAVPQKAAPQELPFHDQTPAGTALAVGTARAQGSTSCHSGKTINLGSKLLGWMRRSRTGPSRREAGDASHAGVQIV